MPSKRRRVRVIVFVVLLFGVGTVLFTPVQSGSAQEGTSIAVGNGTGTPGANVTATVTVRATNVSSYEASLTYDPSIVRVVSVTGVDYADPITNVDPDTGRLNFTQVHVGGLDDPTLARITFRIVGQPTNVTKLSFDPGATVLFDGTSERITVDTYRVGQIQVEAPESETTTRPTTTAVTNEPSGSTTTDASEPKTDSRETTDSATTIDNQDGDGDDGSSPFDILFDETFLLGAGFAVLLVLIGGLGYYLGTRNSR